MGLPPTPPQLQAEPNPSPQAHEERHPSLGQNPFIAQPRCSAHPMPAPEARSQILHPAAPGRRQSHGEGLAGGREGHLAEVGGTGAGHEGVSRCWGGDPRRHNTYNRPRGHPYKNKSHLLRGKGSPAALCTQLWGVCVMICTPQPPPCIPRLPTASGINMWDPEPWGAAAERGGCGQPPEASGPRAAAWVTASLFGRSRGESRDSRASVLLQGHSPPLLWPSPRLWGHGPCFGAWPHSSGQPHRAPWGAGVLRPRFVPLLRGRVAPSLRCGRRTSIAGRRCARPGIGTGERVSAGGQAGVWGCQAAGRGLGQ